MGFGRAVRVTAHADGSVEVSDDGRGLPVAGPGEPTPESALTTFLVPRPPVAGRDWLGYMTANALAAWLRVESRHDGRLCRQDFRRGRPSGPARDVGPAVGGGLSVAFLPDPGLFGDTRLSADDIRDRLREYAFLHGGVRLSWSDRVAGREEVFEYADGVRSFVAWLNAVRRPLHPDVVVARGEADGVRYDVGVQWCAEDDPAGGAFVNGERTREFAGTPVAGLRAAVTRSLNDFARDRLPGAPALRGGQAWDGLTAVVSVRLADPLFAGAART